jgi:hypothetical protein
MPNFKALLLLVDLSTTTSRMLLDDDEVSL